MKRGKQSYRRNETSATHYVADSARDSWIGKFAHQLKRSARLDAKTAYGEARWVADALIAKIGPLRDHDPRGLAMARARQIEDTRLASRPIVQAIADRSGACRERDVIGDWLNNL